MSAKGRYVLREEMGNSGFLFDRYTGVAQYKNAQSFMAIRAREDVDFLPLPDCVSQRARVAPFSVWFELTRKCNLDCIYCGAPPKEVLESLPKREIKLILHDLARSGVFEVRFTGGEPTIYHNFSEVVRDTVEAGLYVSVNSNGVVSDRILKELCVLPIGLFIISLDGVPDVHNSLRANRSYERAVHTVKNLLANGKRVRINTVLCRENKECLPQFVAELKALGVEALTLIPLRPAGRAKYIFEDLRLSHDEFGETLRYVTELRQDLGLEIAASYDLMSEGKIFNTPRHFQKRCVAGVEAACIGPNADLRACILLDDPKYVVGNLQQEPFSVLWANDSLWGIFRDDARLSEKCLSCATFAIQCPGTCQVMAEYFGSPEVDPYCLELNR